MILVCGEALYDVFMGSPTASGALGFEAHVGGSPFNVAVGLARLGTPVALFTGLSRDPLGAHLRDRLEAESVETRHLVRSDRPTTLSLVGVDADGVPAYTFYGSGAADVSLTEADLPHLGPEVAAVHFGSYSIVVPPTADALAALAEREKGRFVSLDPNIRPTVEPSMERWRTRIDRLLAVASLVKVSDEDLALLEPGVDPAVVAADWQAKGPELVVVTRGDAGVLAFGRFGRLDLPARRVDVVDTVGAGDTFQAALLDGLSRAGALSRAALAALDASAIASLLSRAAIAAGLTCSRRGADLPTARDLAAAL